MNLQLQTGPSVNSDGTNPVLRGGKLGEAIVSELNGRYYENAYRGNMFYAVNTAAQALSVASSTYTGLVLQNPVGSVKNLVLLEAYWATSIVPTGVGSVVLGWGTAQTAGVPLVLTTGNSSGPNGLSVLIGSGNKGVAQVGASCTYSVLGAAAAPTILRPLIGIAGAGTNMLEYKDEIGGGLIIAPGYNVCIEAITTAITGFAYFSWAELAI